MTKGFIKNIELVEESFRTDDKFDSRKEIEALNGLINESNPFSLIGFIAEFGSGKSTLLYQIEKGDKERKWITFDAWKYPDRQNLWEGFVLDFAKQIDKNTFDKAREKIDGKSQEPLKKLVEVVGQGLNLFLPGAGIINNLKYFFKTSPARRVFEIQEIFLEIIKKEPKKSVIIVIEDIDRSGDSGVYFLETLKHFISEIKGYLDKEVKIVIPLANKNFSLKQESFYKCLDYIQFYYPKTPSICKLIDDSFEKTFIEDEVKKTQIVAFLELLYIKYPEIMTHRLLKNILRNANNNFIRQTKDEKNSDFRMTIALEAAKYIPRAEGESYFNSFRKSQTIESPTIFGWLLYAIYRKREIDEKLVAHMPFTFINRIELTEGTSIPWYVGKGMGYLVDDDKFFVSNFYLEY